jgi:hypothetical protein
MLRMNGLQTELAIMQERFEHMEAMARALGAKADEARLRLVASEKVTQGANLTRGEAAAFLGVSFRTFQRMEKCGQIARCPGLGMVVRFTARDVLRLASAQGKER